MSISMASLESQTLMNLCLLADRLNISTDDCETKAAVIRALVAPGRAMQDDTNAGGTTNQLAPAHGMATGLNKVKSELEDRDTNPKRRKMAAAAAAEEASESPTTKLGPVDRAAESSLSALANAAVLRSLISYVPHKQFLFFASVARGWRAAWDPRPTLTAEVTPDSSVSQLRYGFDCGLPRGQAPLSSALARLGRLELLRFVEENYSCSVTSATCAAAAESGHLEVLRWLVLHSGSWDRTTCAAAARGGHLEVLRWARRHGCPWDETTCAAAARGGHLLALRWALRHGCPFDATLCAAAAEGGHLSILRGARRRKFPWDSGTSSAAARAGHMHVLKWAVRHGCPWSKNTCSAAACVGNLDALQWVRKRGCEWSPCTCAVAARGGHLAVLQWARRNGCHWRESTCLMAARGGHLPVLRWARENGCPWSEKTCAAAAETGHLAILQWARENDCPWNEATCLRAAEKGFVEILRWARVNGCPWEMDACLESAERAGHKDVVVWILTDVSGDSMDVSADDDDDGLSEGVLRSEGADSAKVFSRDIGAGMSGGDEGLETCDQPSLDPGADSCPQRESSQASALSLQESV